jgi:hypothetical protein
MSQLLTTASTLQCPHGGSVSIASSNTKAKASGSALALSTDTFTIAGCPFQIPVGTGSVPHPCVRVQWTRVNTKTLVNGQPTLSTASVGLCLAADQVPQGNVSVVNIQTQSSGQ